VAADFLITGVGSSAEDPVGTRDEWLQNAENILAAAHGGDVRLAQAAADTVVVKCLWRATTRRRV
jgi:hypothetical protein